MDTRHADDPDVRPITGIADHRPLIGQSFFIYTRVRTLVVLTIMVAAPFARYVLGMEALDIRRLVMLAGIIAAYNTLAWVYYRRYRTEDLPEALYRWVPAVTYGAVIMDFLSLTAAVWLVGGARSPFCAFYLPHVMVSCILLSRRAALTLSAFAYGLVVSLVVVEWWDIATPPLSEGVVAGNDPLSGHHALTLVVVYAMVFSLSVFLLLGLVRSLRRVEHRILLANAELARLSQQRRDFLHIAAHNLRAPVGAVSMMLDNMRSGVAGEITDKQRDWLDRSMRRLGDLSDFMSDIQMLSSLETDIIRTEFTRIDLAGIVTALVEEYSDVAEAHLHTLTLEIPDPVPTVIGHPRLLREAVVNYLTNAIKYTPDGGTIVVRVSSDGSMVRVAVQDSGIGIAAEDQARLFREFVRIPAKSGGTRDVKGSGLGLSIVRRIVLAHGGRTWLESEPGHGSTFYLEIPALKE